jgi:predicted metal-dependent hydrolase
MNNSRKIRSRRRVLAANSRTSSVLHDEEFGDIEIRRVRGSILRLKIQTSGKLVAQLPHFTSVREIQKLLDKSRESLRNSLASMPTKKTYADGDQIGKSHVLRIREGIREKSEVKGLEIIITKNSRTSEKALETLIKDGVAKALRKEAKAYLPRRLKYFQLQFASRGIKYERVQFTHAKSRWGSCSTTGTISLNIMLMTLPPELADYVLLHELNHTIHMDHSAEFWADLEAICPHARQRRKALREYSPYL